MKLVRPRKPGTSARRIAAIAGSATLLAGVGVTAVTGPVHAASARPAGMSGKQTISRCDLANGIQHVVQLTFDNVHFFRDNPNVPSDLELMPNLLRFFTGNGTLLSNNHTPLIAHTANDILTTYTGLYGDRHGMPISNSYRAYNTDGPGGSFNTTDPAGSFAYWTDPVYDTNRPAPSTGADTNPNMVYSPVPPATAATPVTPDTVTPAPWVPFTRAGCNVGEVATANAELENTGVDIPKVFGVNSPENQQLAGDGDPYKDQETNDYVGIAVHCAAGAAFCAGASAVKYGQATASPSASPDLLPQEPGGYTGYQALFGHKYVAPQLGAGSPNLSVHGYQVTNAAGNLVDENGNEIDGQYVHTPGFPGYGPVNASQTLAYMADMLGSGVQVVNGYISDLHGNEHISGVTACDGAPSALGSGTPCYIAQAQYYNQAFGTFFARLAAMGMTPKNTLFILSADEGDHEAGANVGRFVTPQPSTCDGATVSGNVVTPDVYCNYQSGTFGELAGNLTGLLATQKNNTSTPFTVEPDTAPEFYVTGNPGPNDPAVRQLERDVAGLTAYNPYTGTTQPIANYVADPVEEAILHMVNADPARTPTFALFAKPDYYLSAGAANCNAPCVSQTTSYAYDHGAYAAEINTTYLGFAGPGVRHLGVDGSGPADGPSSAGADSGQTTVIQSANPGTWTDHTDIQPTELYLTGLRDDYTADGRVITPILAGPDQALRNPEAERLGACYKQLNSSVGQFAGYTLIASTNAVESSSASDRKYTSVNARLLALEKTRDALASTIKAELTAAAFQDAPVPSAVGRLAACEAVIARARLLAKASG